MLNKMRNQHLSPWGAATLLQSWGDEDIPELLEALGEALKEQAVVLSSWEKYK